MAKVSVRKSYKYFTSYVQWITQNVNAKLNSHGMNILTNLFANPWIWLLRHFKVLKAKVTSYILKHI